MHSNCIMDYVAKSEHTQLENSRCGLTESVHEKYWKTSLTPLTPASVARQWCHPADQSKLIIIHKRYFGIALKDFFSIRITFSKRLT